MADVKAFENQLGEILLFIPASGQDLFTNRRAQWKARIGMCWLDCAAEGSYVQGSRGVHLVGDGNS